MRRETTSEEVDRRSTALRALVALLARQAAAEYHRKRRTAKWPEAVGGSIE